MKRPECYACVRRCVLNVDEDTLPPLQHGYTRRWHCLQHYREEVAGLKERAARRGEPEPQEPYVLAGGIVLCYAEEIADFRDGFGPLKSSANC